MGAVAEVLEHPEAKRAYEVLEAVYSGMGMTMQADVVKFLIAERFGGDFADRPDACEEQRVNGGEGAGLVGGD